MGVSTFLELCERLDELINGSEVLFEHGKVEGDVK